MTLGRRKEVAKFEVEVHVFQTVVNSFSFSLDLYVATLWAHRQVFVQSRVI